MIERVLGRDSGLVLMSANFGSWKLSVLVFAKKYPVALIRQSSPMTLSTNDK
ncbi:MAG: hypothetical protein LBN01_00545 [Endomicrobium sp.]|nr:hypothetical protein [Endomicrobium sp.]